MRLKKMINSIPHKDLLPFIEIAQAHHRINDEAAIVSDIISKSNDKIDELLDQLEINRQIEIELYKKMAAKYNVDIDVFKQAIIDIISTYDNNNNNSSD